MRPLVGLAVGVSVAISAMAATAAAWPAASFMRASYTWSGADPTDEWKPDCNWHPGPICSDDGEDYPDGTDDDATFPTNGGTTWDVELIDETIGDLTILESVTFTSPSGVPVTMEVTKLVITGGTSSDTTVQMSGATIKDAP